MKELQINSEIDRIDEEENALDSLEMVAEFIGRSDVKHRWKWISIALSNALYGFCIIALKGGTFNNVVETVKCKKCKTPYSSAFDLFIKNCHCPTCGNDLSNVKPRLISFSEAFKRVQKDGQIKGYDSSKGIIFTSKQIKSVRRLQEYYRNNFEHFLPKVSWFTHQNHEIVLDATEVIEKIVEAIGFNSVIIEEGPPQRFQTTVEKIKIYCETKIQNNSADNL